MHTKVEAQPAHTLGDNSACQGQFSVASPSRIHSVRRERAEKCLDL